MKTFNLLLVLFIWAVLRTSYSFAQELQVNKSLAYIDPESILKHKGIDLIWMNSSKPMKLSYLNLSNDRYDNCKIDFANLRELNSTDNIMSIDNPDEILFNSKLQITQEDCTILNKGLESFENWKFDESQKILLKYVEGNPEDAMARYYLAVSQINIGLYGPAAYNFSLLNKNLSIMSGGAHSKLLDEIKLYFAICELKISDDKKIAKTLFNQLNYEGGKYQYIAKGMMNLL